MKSHKNILQCDFASVQASNLRKRLKTHTGENSYKCSHCDFATNWASHSNDNLKTHYGGKASKEDIQKFTLEKNHANVTNITMHVIMQRT